MLKRTISAIIAILLLAAIFASCKDKDNSTGEISDANSVTEKQIEDETAETPDPNARIMPDLPDMDFEGRVYKVLANVDITYAQFNNFEIDADEITGDLVNDAVYNRNSRLEEKYNVLIEQELHTDVPGVTKRLTGANEDIYSLIFVHQQNINPLATQGLFCDLNLLKYLDFGKPWWNKKANNDISVGGRLFYTISDFSLQEKSRTSIMAFNKDMAKLYDLGNFYDLVYEGKWTIDKMAELSKVVAGDIDGDGEMTDSDRWGFGASWYGGILDFFISSDNRITTKDANDYPVLSLNNERTISAIDKILNLTRNNPAAFCCQDFNGKVSYDYWYTSSNVFMDGRLLFADGFPHSLKDFAASEVDYGVLPFPKYDENQKDYIGVVNALGSLFAVPVTVQNTDFAAFMLEALSAASKYEVLPYYYEITTKTKYTQDEESAKMLDLVFSNIRFDLGRMYNWGNTTNNLFVTQSMAVDGINDFASKYEAIEDLIKQEMEKTIASYTEVSQ